MHDPIKSTRPELLSPAGSLEAFFAAMEGGADAVYCGLKDFSARAKAKNFTLSDVEKMLGYAHGLGRKLYITLNTLVKEKELPALAETLASLEAMGADAVIVQDLAVWRLVREHFSALPLHASTQMTVHNAAGVTMLERMGFTRGVLARELSLAEIAGIRARTTLELEHFIHGALCFCYSGQCFFSSWLGGKSGNRGRCAQPCRRRYSYRGQEGYYFSTNDLSAIDLLPELASAGVISFKIEGRMKSAEYVSSVVAAYRSVLDAPASRRSEAVRAAKEKLKGSFGRLPTRGFLPGGVPSDIAIPSVKGATGRFLGEVVSEKKGTITFKSRDRLHVGDRLRVQPKSDKAGTAFTVKELSIAGKGAMVAPPGTKVTVPSPFNGIFRPGDAIFKVSSDQAFTLSEAACRRRLEGAAPPAAPLRLIITLNDGELTVRGNCGALGLERSYPVETFPAEERPLSLETLEGVFARSGDAPFFLEALEGGDLPAVVIPPSRLKAIRRDFFAEMQRELSRWREMRKKEHLDAALADLLPPTAPRTGGRSVVTVGIDSVRDAHLLGDSGVDRLLIPLTASNVQGALQSGRRLSGREEKVVWEIPFILMQEEWELSRQWVRLLTQKGYRNFRLNNLGHFPLFDSLEESVVLGTGWRLFSLNSQALLSWRSLGAAEATLYLEDDRENLRELLCRRAGIETALTVYASVPLITSRIPIKGVRSDTPVLSDRGEPYRVMSRSGQSILTSETDFSLLGRLNDLQNLGCSRFVLELGHLGPFSVRGRGVLDCLRQGKEAPGTSPFNYDAGME
jgi:U32 family peptidase